MECMRLNSILKTIKKINYMPIETSAIVNGKILVV